MHNVFIGQYFNWKPAEPSSKARVINRLLARLGMWHHLSPPPTSGWMSNIEKRMNMFHLLAGVLEFGVPGDVVELGCHTGHGAALLETVIKNLSPDRTLHLYDSFGGLPEPTQPDADTPYGRGDMKSSVDAVRASFRAYGLREPTIHVGWFEDTLPNQLPETICFAHLDGDFYESILTSLRYVYPKLAPGAVCLIDDYADPEVLGGWNWFPGVKAACDEFLADKAESVSVLYSGENHRHGYFRRALQQERRR